MLERTVIYVDTSYLLASFYNSWEIGARAQLEIDLPEVVATLGDMASNQLGQKIHRQNWYDGIPDTGPHRYQRALRTCDGVQLRTGQLIEWGERRTQKAVDTRLVADMVIAACNQQVTDMVLVSGDADMIPGVQEATSAGIRVHLYGFGWDSMSAALRHACDTTTILDPREDFSECMELQVLEGPLPTAVREPSDSESPASTESESVEHDGDELAYPPRESADAPLAPDDVRNGTPGDTDKDDSSPATPLTPASPTSQPAASPSQSVDRDDPSEVEAELKNHAHSSSISSTTPTTDLSDIDDDADSDTLAEPKPTTTDRAQPTPRPNPSMMAPRRKLRSRYVPLPEEIWTSAGFQTPFDVGQQYASWWYENAASSDQRDQAHLLSGGGLPPEIDRPLLQFACETLHEYTLSETQRVNLRDGFHSGIRGVLINVSRSSST